MYEKIRGVLYIINKKNRQIFTLATRKYDKMLILCDIRRLIFGQFCGKLLMNKGMGLGELSKQTRNPIEDRIYSQLLLWAFILCAYVCCINNEKQTAADDPRC